MRASNEVDDEPASEEVLASCHTDGAVAFCRGLETFLFTTLHALASLATIRRAATRAGGCTEQLRSLASATCHVPAAWRIHLPLPSVVRAAALSHPEENEEILPDSRRCRSLRQTPTPGEWLLGCSLAVRKHCLYRQCACA
jgi:hypothetical protein